MEYQGYDISPSRALIPKLQRLLHIFRSGGFPVYHTREGQFPNSRVVDETRTLREDCRPSTGSLNTI
jgi:hypothetical protein